MILAAHFFMIFGGLIVLSIALAGVLALGMILLIIGLISRHLNKKKGIKKRYPKVCIIIGGIFMTISLGTFGMFTLDFLDDSENKYNPDTYDPHTSTMIQDDEYCKEIIQEVLRCLDEEDEEGLKEMFSEYSMELYDIDSQIEEAMEIYDGKSLEYGEISCSESGAYVEYGYYYSKYYDSKIKSVFTDEGKEYYIHVNICLVSEKKSKEGIVCMRIMDPNNSNKTLAQIGKYY